MPPKKNLLLQPFLKWAGGKRQLLPELSRNIPSGYKTYIEPFVGGGALLFSLQPQTAVINDINAELANVYEVVKNDAARLADKLREYVNDEDHYYSIRELDRKPEYNRLSPLERAARIIYLNKTCYNGLFRVNSQGQFNVPFGNYKNPNFADETILCAAGNYLNKHDVKIHKEDFEKILNIYAKKDAFVYLDPPYDPVSSSASFTGYTLDGFSKAEQERLRKVCDTLDRKGCKFLLSNSATEFILNLYKDYDIQIVKASRHINSDAEKRGEIDEVLLKNF
jgi:DNA adenine methylase